MPLDAEAARLTETLPTNKDTGPDGKTRGSFWLSNVKRRLVANPHFRSVVQRTPLLRSIASQSANNVFQLTSGFINSQILLACEELNLFEELSTPTSVLDLSKRWQMTPQRTERLLHAAQGLKLVYAVNQHQYALDEHGIVIAQSAGIRAMIRHHAAVYRDLADPVALLKRDKTNTETARFWSYVGDGEQWGKNVGSKDANNYSTLMRLSQAMVIEQVLDAYAIGHKHIGLIDIGGGDGAFVAAAAARWKRLDVGIFDLPAVAENARKRLASCDFSDRLNVYGGSFFDDDIPTNADCFSLIRVLYDHNDDAALSILRSVRKAMAPGDTLVIGEPLAGDKQGERLVQAYFSFYLLAMQSGKCRTARELKQMLKRAGFASARQIQTAIPVISGAIVARA
ncbi:MAG: methyltransferase [Pseudomonadota bacterium]